MLEELQTRYAVYKDALQSAEIDENPSKVRRYKRIVAQYEKCMKGARTGNPVGLADLPNPPGFPPLPKTVKVTVEPDDDSDVDLELELDLSPQPSAEPSPELPKKNTLADIDEPEAPRAPPRRPAPPPPNLNLLSPTQAPEDDDGLLGQLNLRLQVYQSTLQSAEIEGVPAKVRRYKRIIGQYSDAIKSAKAGKPVDVSELPNPPDMPPLPGAPVPSPLPSPMPSPLPKRAQPPDATPAFESLTGASAPDFETPVIEEPELAEEADETVSEKLIARLKVYQSTLAAAEEENAPAKVRRYKRIIQQYNDAIKSEKAGKAIDLAELPNPPDMPPLVPPAPSPKPSPMPSPTPTRAHPPAATPAQATPPEAKKTPPRSRAERQTELLKERQKEYRDAALNAKRAGQNTEALEYLKISKSFDRLIRASEGGLPVDLSTIPVSIKAVEEAEEAFHMVSEKDLTEKSDVDIYEMIKGELEGQIKSCMVHRAHLKNIGDVANANRFEQWALTFKKDLNKVMLYQSSGQPLPKFKYEQKSFAVVRCFSDVAAGELELTIVQAVGLPKPCDTYIGYEFPYPSESPPSGYTSVVKASVNPDFNHKVNFPIDRDSKPCQRIFKRHGIKLEIWAKGGFLRRDTSLGVAEVKLVPLAQDIMIHDAFDFKNGRRPTGVKVEVKIRVREPLVTKKIESISEKWLILD